MPSKSRWRGARCPCRAGTGARTRAADADRHVDPEDPAPGHVGDDQAAEDDAEHGAGAPADSVVTVGPAAPLGREEVGDHGAAVGGHQGAADPLEDAEADNARSGPRRGAQRSRG